MSRGNKTGEATAARPPHKDKEPSLPSSNVRTIVNLLLFIHLFCLAIAFFWQTNSSPVSVQLHSIPAGYLKPLHMDLAFDDGHREATSDAERAISNVRHRERSRRAMLHFTHGGPLDDELFIEFIHGPEDDRLTIVLPPQGMLPPMRRERFQRLAWEIGRAAGDSGAREVFARVIAGALLNRLNVDEGELRVLRRRTQTMNEATANDDDITDPFNESYQQVLISFRARRVGATVVVTAIEQANSTSGGAESTSSNAPAVDETAQPDQNEPRAVPRLGPVRPGGGK